MADAPAEVVPYRYVFCDLLTDAYICDLTLDNVTYDRRIIEPGTFRASVEIANADIANQVARIVPRHPDILTTGPGRTVVHVYRGSQIWGTYLIWQAVVSQRGRDNVTVELQGAGLESYLAHVDIRADIGEITGVDQVQIARQLITHMQTDAYANIGLQLQSGASGVPRDLIVLAADGRSYGDRLVELARSENGFEWTIHTSVDPGTGVRTRHWVWGYPQLGSITSNHVFAQPGNVTSWQESIDALKAATKWQVRGDSVNSDITNVSSPLLSDIVPAQDYLDAGWPRTDGTHDYNKIGIKSVLDNYAAWWAANRAGAMRIHQASVRLPANTAFSPVNLGDYVRLVLTNDWWPIINGSPSFSKSWRVIGIAVTPPDRNKPQEECVLTFAEEMEP
ncbi:hypothetical protein AB0395_41170 [Streptosporangium sp. NPDC051023]|uniref:hypothetical protein n=1 Tax=Streptosporangium sp. NPDC051023 TaxID=3155410 RepID=UPI00344F1EDC